MSRLRRPANVLRNEILAGIREFDEMRKETDPPGGGACPMRALASAIGIVRAGCPIAFRVDGWTIRRAGVPAGNGAIYLQ